MGDGKSNVSTRCRKQTQHSRLASHDKLVASTFTREEIAILSEPLVTHAARNRFSRSGTCEFEPQWLLLLFQKDV